VVWTLGRREMMQSSGSVDLWQWQARFSNLQANFRNTDYTLETLVGAFLVLAWPLVLLGPLLREHRILAAGFLVSLLINSAMVLFMAKAREARLFALPLLVVWPLLGLRSYKITAVKFWFRIGPLVLLLLGVAGTLHLAWNLYQSTVGPNNANFFREYLSVYGISLALAWYWSRTRTEQT